MPKAKLESVTNSVESSPIGGAGDTYILPYKVIGRKTENLMFIEFKGRSIESLGAFQRAANMIGTGSDIGTWSFIAPNSIIETCSHTYEPFETVGSRISQAMINIGKVVRDASVVGSTAMAALDASTYNGNPIENAKGNINAGLTTPKNKIDTVMSYKDTDAKTYDFDFEIAWMSKNDPEDKIFKPIRELTKASCAEIAGSMTKINWPAIFSVRSKVGGTYTDLINIKYGVITSIQPSWNYPFVNGYPSNCKVSIKVTDIEPMYSSSWE